MKQPHPRAAVKSRPDKASAEPAAARVRRPFADDAPGQAPAGAIDPAAGACSPKADVRTLRGRAEDFQRDLWAAPDVAAAIAALSDADAQRVEARLDALSKVLRRPYDPAWLDRLRACEGHGLARVRLWCAQALACPETEAEIAALIRLGADPAPQVRGEAIRALAGAPMDSPALRDALGRTLEHRDWESFDLRLAAIQGLAARDDARAIAAIEHVLEMDPLELIGEDERLAAVCALVRAHPRPRYLPPLEAWRRRLVGSPDECDEAWIEPVLEAIETCSAARAPGRQGAANGL